MPVLQPSEYDERYFDGKNQTYTHNAGYTDYNKIQYNQISARYLPIEESTGNVFGDLCKGLNIKLTNRFIGKSLLVIGCAYGFEVKGFRDLGIDAYGIDVSDFAISQADPSIQPFLEVTDIRTKVEEYSRNQWDYIFSRWLLECISDDDLTTLIPELNRVCKNNQVHIINTQLQSDYYNTKNLTDWQTLDFDRGTILIANDNFDEYITI